MENREDIHQYDLVEIIRVPEQYAGVIDIGDVGVVVEKYDEENFQVECILPGGASKWLERLNIRNLRLRSKDPYHPWIKTTLAEEPIMQRSVFLGAAVGAISGGLIGAGFGATTRTLNGILIGLLVGLILGAVTGALTAALTVKTAGTSGGIGVGYFTGMVFGGVFGMIVGVLIPTSWRLSAHTEDVPVLDALAMGRFETAILISFLLSILATIVGVWVSGKNFIPRNLRERYRP
jgi:MFS family permease